jgi:hypothetical protein
MADLTTYEGLKAAVADWLGRKDLASRIPNFIRLAELRMNRELRLRIMEQVATAYVPAGVFIVELPERRVDGDWKVFLEMRDLAWKCRDGGTVQNLRYTPPDEYKELGQQSGMPRQYTIIANRLYLLPAPDAAGELRLTYYGEIPPLSDEQQSNNVLRMFPDLYLYGALVESGPFTRSSAPLEMWTQYYAAARQKAEANERRARFTANLQMKPARRV